MNLENSSRTQVPSIDATPTSVCPSESAQTTCIKNILYAGPVGDVAARRQGAGEGAEEDRLSAAQHGRSAPITHCTYLQYTTLLLNLQVAARPSAFTRMRERVRQACTIL